MGDNVGCGELEGIAGAAVKARLDLAEEAGIEEDGAVRRAVERAHRRLRHAAAAAIGGVAEQHDLGAGIGLAAGLENFAPAIVDLAEHAGDHAAHLVGRGATLGGRGRLAIGLVGRRLTAASEDLGAADQDARIDAEGVADQAEHDDGADPEPAAAHRKTEPAASTSAAAIIAATVFDVVAAAEIIVSHGGLPSVLDGIIWAEEL